MRIRVPNAVRDVFVGNAAVGLIKMLRWTNPHRMSDFAGRFMRKVGPKLREHGLYFVGLDLIGEKLIEVNVTSPTGIQELGRHQGKTPEQDVIAWVEKRAFSAR